MSTGKREKKNEKPSEWLDKALRWFDKQQEKWYGFIINCFGLPLLLIFTLISWPVRCVVYCVRENSKKINKGI